MPSTQPLTDALDTLRENVSQAAGRVPKHPALRPQTFVLPQIPLTEVDRVNRRAAATGSVGYAMATGDADYNGHPVTVSFKPHAVGGPRWTAEYYCGGRVVLSRGTFGHCIDRACREYDRGHRGATVVAYTHESAPETLDQQAAACRRAGMVEMTTGTNPYEFACSPECRETDEAQRAQATA